MSSLPSYHNAAAAPRKAYVPGVIHCISLVNAISSYPLLARLTGISGRQDANRKNSGSDLRSHSINNSPLRKTNNLTLAKISPANQSFFQKSHQWPWKGQKYHKEHERRTSWWCQSSEEQWLQTVAVPCGQSRFCYINVCQHTPFNPAGQAFFACHLLAKTIVIFSSCTFAFSKQNPHNFGHVNPQKDIGISQDGCYKCQHSSLCNGIVFQHILSELSHNQVVLDNQCTV